MHKSILIRIVLVIGFLGSSVFGIYFLFRTIAIQKAVQACDSFHFRADQDPFNIQVQFLTGDDAFHTLQRIGHTNIDDLKYPVWAVNMDGRWHIFGGPLPEDGQPSSNSEYFDHCTVLVNAFTFHSIYIQAKPQTDDK